MCAGYRSVAHYLVLTQRVATSAAGPKEPPVTEEATTTTAVQATHADSAQMPCAQQPCDPPQQSIATEAQGMTLITRYSSYSSGLYATLLLLFRTSSSLCVFVKHGFICLPAVRSSWCCPL